MASLSLLWGYLTWFFSRYVALWHNKYRNGLLTKNWSVLRVRFSFAFAVRIWQLAITVTDHLRLVVVTTVCLNRDKATKRLTIVSIFWKLFLSEFSFIFQENFGIWGSFRITSSLRDLKHAFQRVLWKGCSTIIKGRAMQSRAWMGKVSDRTSAQSHTLRWRLARGMLHALDSAHFICFNSL